MPELRDLRRRVDDLTPPPVDVAALVAAGERHLRRRRRGIVAGAAAVVLAVAVAVTSLTARTPSSNEPVGEPTPTVEDGVHGVRQLTYAIGSTIYYGGEPIEVHQYVHFLDVTDDGVAFVRQAPGTDRYEQPGPKALWFTDGSSVTRIGTVHGSPARGYGVTASESGSILVWETSVEDSFETGTVVFDTGALQVVPGLSGAVPDRRVLGIDDDVVYWVPEDAPCSVEGALGCLEPEWVVRYDTEAAASERVSWATYDADVRSRPGTVVGTYDGTFGRADLDFTRRGTELITQDRDGELLRLRVPGGSTTATSLSLSHWLDDDRFVLFGYTSPYGGSELADEGDLFVCALSTAECRLELKGEPGTAYQLPGLD